MGWLGSVDGKVGVRKDAEEVIMGRVGERQSKSGPNTHTHTLHPLRYFSYSISFIFFFTFIA